MNDIISLDDYRAEAGPYLSGPARCMACKHEWVAVAPAGTTELECPHCGAMKGFFLGTMDVPVGETHWTCRCGSDIFRISGKTKDIFCANCGLTQSAD